MAQYLLAQWDYTAEGNFELSFKEGDKIKLLEKHNKDWWEGELNDEIGFFPANRTTVYPEEQQQQVIDLKASISSATSSYSSSAASRTVPTHITNSAEYNNNNNVPPPERPVLLPVPSNTSISHSNPYLQTTSKLVDDRETVPVPTSPRIYDNETVLVDITTESEDLPSGWSCSQDDSGRAFFFNKSTGESQWEKPLSFKLADENKSRVATEESLTQTRLQSTPLPSTFPSSSVGKYRDNTNDLGYDIQKLNLEALHPKWIRIQSAIQIKVVSVVGGETEVSWKDYYGVLTNGFLLVYKEGLSRIGRRPSSMKPIPAYFTINLKSSKIAPAAKIDTRKKHAFIINLPKHRVFVNVSNEALYTEWLDTIMREVIGVKENAEQQDAYLVQLLASISLYPKQELPHKPTSPSTDHTDDVKSSKTLTRWFSRSNRNSTHKSQPLAANNSTSTNTTTSCSLAPGDEIFGGYLKLEEDGSIPRIVRLCIEQVDKRGLDVVGIYRLSGQTTSIQKYKTQFNSRPEQVNLDEEQDINVITGLLKLYFRELKSPLLTFEYYDRFIEAARLSDYQNERIFRLKSIIQVLPVANFKVLQYLMRHLERVKNNSHVNKMEASNLALIFSIGLLRPKSDDLSASIMHNNLQSKVIEIIIMHVYWFFDSDTNDDDNDESSVKNSSSIIL